MIGLAIASAPTIRRIKPKARAMINRMQKKLRSGAIDAGVGALPRIDADVASCVSYCVGKAVSKEDHQFSHSLLCLTKRHKS